MPARRIRIVSRTGRAMFSARQWRILLGEPGRVRLLASVLAERAVRLLQLRLRAAAAFVGLPQRDALATQLAAVCARGVLLNFVFSKSDPGLVLLREDAGRIGVRLESDRRMQVCEVEHADHTFAGASARQRLYAALDMLLAAPSALEAPRADRARQAAAAACP